MELPLEIERGEREGGEDAAEIKAQRGKETRKYISVAERIGTGCLDCDSILLKKKNKKQLLLRGAEGWSTSTILKEVKKGI